VAALLRCVDQTNNGVLYPLGWYLSATARTGMEAQVGRAALDRGCSVATQ
jgi:hypothetical protein